MARSDTRAAVARLARPYLWTLRGAVLLHLAMLAYQFVTAGQLVAGGVDALPFHAVGAIAVHVAAAIQLAAAALYWRPGRGAPLPAVLSVIAFPLGLLQAYFGSHDLLLLHVPTAMILVALVVWALVWSWTPAARRARR